MNKSYKISQKYHLRMMKKAEKKGNKQLALYHKEIYEDQIKHGKIVERPIREGYYKIIFKER